MARTVLYSWTVSLLTCLTLIAGALGTAGGTADAPEVLDDGGADDVPSANLNVVSGWVGNETGTHFSLFMRIRSLAPPADDSKTVHYHFHFQVVRTDGATHLYHAMVHHDSAGAWAWMVQEWAPGAPAGSWGNTHDAAGYADEATGTLEVQVAKVWVESPKVDMVKNTWTIDSFYIHADLTRNADATVESTDSAPGSGTMGSYAVSVGAPMGASATGSSPLVLAGLAAAALIGLALFLRQRRAPGAGR